MIIGTPFLFMCIAYGMEKECSLSKLYADYEINITSRPSSLFA